MNIKHDNSMYTSTPPETFICTNADEQFVLKQITALEEQIEEHNFEESYELTDTIREQEIEQQMFQELIKHEPRCKC